MRRYNQPSTWRRPCQVPATCTQRSPNPCSRPPATSSSQSSRWTTREFSRLDRVQGLEHQQCPAKLESRARVWSTFMISCWFGASSGRHEPRYQSASTDQVSKQSPHSAFGGVGFRWLSGRCCPELGGLITVVGSSETMFGDASGQTGKKLGHVFGSHLGPTTTLGTAISNYTGLASRSSACCIVNGAHFRTWYSSITDPGKC
jgi:hypothetical protein